MDLRASSEMAADFGPTFAGLIWYPIVDIWATQKTWLFTIYRGWNPTHVI